MKISAFFILLLLAIKTYSVEPEIQEVKNLFEASVNNKDSATRLLELLDTVNESSSPLLICYKGAAEMMQAKHALNPINKFKRFKRGKKLIEEAVKKDSKNIEIRFLRFCIQTNLPYFLNYNDNIQEDKAYLLVNLKTTKDKILKQKVLNYLYSSKHCTVEEKKELKT